MTIDAITAELRAVRFSFTHEHIKRLAREFLAKRGEAILAPENQAAYA
jgi:hypothetical protein